MAEERNWLDLPSDFLITIFVALEIPDLFRCAAVCSSWRRITATMRGFRLKQAPWLMFSPHSGDGDGDGDGSDPAACPFYSLSEKKIYTIPLPDPPIRTRTCIGSAHGWLITADVQGNLHLLNPITRSQIALPHISTLELWKTVVGPTGDIVSYIVGSKDHHTVVTYTLEEFSSCVFEKATMSCSPSEGRDCIVMLIHNPGSRLAFARPGDNRWNSLPNPRYGYIECMYSGGGLFHAVRMDGNIEVWDLRGPFLVSEFMPLWTEDSVHHRKYLVHTSPPDGRLSQVWIQWMGWYNEFMELHEWVFGKPSSGLVKMTSLVDHALFLSDNHSFCLPTKDLPGLRPNSIYIIDSLCVVNRFYQDHSFHYNLYIYHMEDERLENVLPPGQPLDRSLVTWITPSLT